MKIIENIARRICRKLTKNQVIRIIKVLQNLLDDPETIFKKPEPEYTNYRKFKVDSEPPLTKPPDSIPELDYRRFQFQTFFE